MPTGMIHVQAFAGEVLPVEAVNIRITDEFDAELAQLTTDREGDSPSVQVWAPPAALSLDEENTAQLPYAVYTVHAEKEGYAPVTVRGVQVFEGQTSLQLLTMQPLTGDDAVPASEEVFSIPTHHLFDPDAPQPSTAPRLECERPWVLSSVIIPSYITVHLGRPSASARDVTVTFRDYIKNVCCSEIYPTWPENALRANIYCQISLALNRVFTEWYLSKGYSFQITNSTSYDQYYVHGRNIFENVSRIVDELFATYIRRPGTVNPFYAEYCDGKQVTCPGLKQWGTVTLANQGYTPYRILTYYYGSNLELVTSDNIAAIPQSYPGAALTVGSSGTAVRTIQRQLNRIAKNYPAFGTLTVDGVYGTDTAAVVRRFQRQFNLSADGVVGYATWYKISYIYVAVKKLAELGSEGEFPNQDSVGNAEGAFPGTNLSAGSSGTAVRQVQYWLNTVRGYIEGLPLLEVDGIFGQATAAAVRTFQAWAGLTTDGIVGRATWNALYREFSSVILEENTELGYVTEYPGTPLRQGSRGNAVRTLQFWLLVVSDQYSQIPAVAVDGSFGPATAAAVRAFQQVFGLTVDGVVGAATWNRLRQIFASVALQLVPGSQFPGTYPGSPLRRGDSGDAVREMQYYLYVLSLYYPTIPVISYDGSFGAATQSAVIAFQQLFGLTADGVVGPSTWSALYAQYIRIITVEGAARSSVVPAYSSPLGLDSEGSLVLWLQQALQLISLFYPAVRNPIPEVNPTGQPVPPDEGVYDDPGEYKRYTYFAVQSFQREFGLPPTGEVDRATWDRLVEVYSFASAQDIYGEQEAAVSSGYEWGGRVLQEGSFGPYVLQLQRMLNQLAEEYCGVGYVAEDGIFRAGTLRAVQRVQRDAGQPETDSVDRATWQAIMDALEPAAQTVRGTASESAVFDSVPEIDIADTAQSRSISGAGRSCRCGCDS